MEIRFVKPHPVLTPYIERYWIWSAASEKQIYMPQIPPGLGIDLFIHYREPFTIKQGKLPSSHIIFSGEHSCNILPMNNIGFVAIRFKVGMFKNFTQIPFHELTDGYLNFENLWGSEGKRTLERINSVGNTDDLIKIVEPFLLKLLNSYKKVNLSWDHIVKQLYYNHSDCKLSEISQKLNISYRHFRRKFIEETGFTPKHFQRLARFRSVLKPLLLNKESRYLPLALDKGFFDQTHFIKEFKYFTHSTPTEFLQDKNFMSHFYYPSLY